MKTITLDNCKIRIEHIVYLTMKPMRYMEFEKVSDKWGVNIILLKAGSMTFKCESRAAAEKAIIEIECLMDYGGNNG